LDTEINKIDNAWYHTIINITNKKVLNRWDDVSRRFINIIKREMRREREREEERKMV
jgi:hypothetical protein